MKSQLPQRPQPSRMSNSLTTFMLTAISAYSNFDRKQYNVGGYMPLPENMRTNALGAEVDIVDRLTLQTAIFKYLRLVGGIESLLNLNRKYGQLCLHITGLTLRIFLMQLEDAGLLASRFNVKRRKTYIYDEETWAICKDMQKEFTIKKIDRDIFEETENSCDPKTRKLSGAQRRKLGMP